MLKRILMTTALTLAVGLSLPAHAASITYTAILSGTHEVPPNASAGTGAITLTLTGDILSVDLTFSGLTNPASAGHIHCCTPVGTNAIVAVPFTGLPNATSGTYTNSFDLTLASSYNAAFITASGGTVAAAEAALIAGLDGGTAYANLHNATFPAGEIRGQLAITPEPSTLLLLGTGAVGAIQTIRRRRLVSL